MQKQGSQGATAESLRQALAGAWPPGFARLLSHCVWHPLSVSSVKSPGEICHQVTLGYLTGVIAGCWCQFLFSTVINGFPVTQSALAVILVLPE